MNNEIEALLYEVAYKVAAEMGSELLEMSCFVSNWTQLVAAPSDEEYSEAA